jgi:hypothetical protein
MIVGLFLRHIKAYKGISYIPLGHQYNFISYINDSKEAAIFLFIGGLFVSFLNYKKDKDERVMRFLNKWL